MSIEWREFPKALLRHWIPLLTGGVVMAMVASVEHRTGTSVPWSYYSALVAGLLFYACFLAWRDEFRRRQMLEVAFSPKLLLACDEFRHRPAVQDLGPSTDILEQRLFRIAVRNMSSVAVQGAQVVLERVDSLLRDGFLPGHGLRVMGGQGSSPRFDIGPLATEWIDLIGYELRSNVERYFIPYAIGEHDIPAGVHAFVLRCDGGGLPARARVVANCPNAGRFEIIECRALAHDLTSA